MRFIGDVHGKYRQYRKIIRDCPASVQVGDMGVGFRYCGGPRDGEFQPNPPYDAMREGDHRFIRGNHDNPEVCKQHSQWIADGATMPGIMYIGGAHSIDRAWRVEGYSWWPDEQLSTSELSTLVGTYISARPSVMVTHDCPEDLAPHLNSSYDYVASRTRQAFQAMWSAHSPKLWIFGHWHTSFDHVLNGTRFICLNELEHIDLELPV